jgi:hypothetical protein
MGAVSIGKQVKAAVAAMMLAAAGFAMPAAAYEDPIPLIDVIVKKTPPGNAFVAQTNRNGRLVFKNLPAGNYVVSDRSGHKKSFVHRGGPAKWQIVVPGPNGKPVWTLMDDSNPL